MFSQVLALAVSPVKANGWPSHSSTGFTVAATVTGGGACGQLLMVICVSVGVSWCKSRRNASASAKSSISLVSGVTTGSSLHTWRWSVGCILDLRLLGCYQWWALVLPSQELVCSFVTS